jgi:hypothetical protein
MEPSEGSLEPKFYLILLTQLYSSPTRLFADEISLPDNAVDKLPNEIGPRVIFFPDTKHS